MRTIKFRCWNGAYMSAWEAIKEETTLETLNFGDILVFMQFTGLLDKNGKEVYEGDIVKYYHHPNEVCVIKWNEELLTYTITVVSEKIECEDYFFIKSDSSKVEIIGNICSNPNLLK